MPPRPEAEKVEAKPEPPGFVPAFILRNKGVPIVLYRLENGKLPELEGEDEEWPTRTVHVRFNANAVAEVEDAFDGLELEVPVVERTVKTAPDGAPLEGPQGLIYDEKVVGRETRRYYGLEAFQMAMQAKATSTARKVLSVALGWPEREVGEAMIPDRMMDYTNAIGVAWSIAQGVDPTDAAKTLQRASAAVAAARANLASQLEKTMAEAEA